MWVQYPIIEKDTAGDFPTVGQGSLQKKQEKGHGYGKAGSRDHRGK